MHLSVTGHHVEISAPLRSYVEKKLERLVRHSDHVIDAHCVLTVEKLQQRAEATLHLRGETVHALAEDANMYAAIDALADKLDRRGRQHQEKSTNPPATRGQNGAPRRMPVPAR